MNSIYLAAVVPDKHDPGEHTPYVSTPLGPYRPDETDAMDAGRAWLKDTYATEDVRRVEPENDTADFDTARSMVMRAVGVEHQARRLEMERERAESALSHVQPEVWAAPVDGGGVEGWRPVGYIVDEAPEFLSTAPDGREDRPFRDGLTLSVTVDVSPATGDLDRLIRLLGVRPEDV